MLNKEKRLLPRYFLNGVVATAVHFLVLTVNIELVHFELAGMANLVAAFAGSSIAFLGNRYFVFRKLEESALRQAVRFGGLYISMACLHGASLYVWSDVYKLDYRIGFVFATALQVVLSYWGNKFLVFKT